MPLRVPRSQGARTARRRWIGRVAAVLVAVLVALAAAEGGVRLVLRARGEPWRAEAARVETRRTLTMLAHFVPDPGAPSAPVGGLAKPRMTHLHPFLAFETDAERAQLESVLAWARDARSYGATLGVVLGGSVANGFANGGTDALAAELRTRPGFEDLRLRWLPLGRGAYRQPQQALFLVWLLSIGVEPDLVILLDGFNEVALGVQSASYGTHPSFPSYPVWSHLATGGGLGREALDHAVAARRAQRDLERLGAFALRRDLFRSAALGAPVLGRVHELAREIEREFGAYGSSLEETAAARIARGPDDPRFAADPLASCVAVWADSARLVHQLCAARGIPSVHVLQPTLHDPGAKPMTDDERRTGTISNDWLTGVLRGYPLLREQGAELAKEGLLFLDASRVFADVEDTLYFDACHFDRSGNEILARFLADFVAEHVDPAQLRARPTGADAPPR